MNLFTNWEKKFLHLISQTEKRSLATWLLQKGLLLLSYPYGVAIAIRNWAYDRGWLKTYTPKGAIIISVGNIVAGGAGKTPVIQLLVHALGPHSSLAILSRGYRSHAERLTLPTLLSDGKGILYPASFCGDEPYMIATRFPSAMVYVGRDRVAAAKAAIARGAKIVLLDDGMQHRRLGRQHDMVVINAMNPFGFGHYLPRGLLRDQIGSLARANLILLNNVESLEQAQEIEKQIGKYSQAPLVATASCVSSIEDGLGNAYSLTGEKVALFCGIASPTRFVQLVKQQGAEIVETQFFGDHHAFVKDELENFVRLSAEKGASYLVCTEKDFVKVRQWQFSIPLLCLKMDLEILHGRAAWEQFLKDLKD